MDADPPAKTSSLSLLGAAALSLAVLLSVSLAGAFVVGPLGTPTLEDVDGGFGAVNDTHTEFYGVVTVDNPNPVGTPAFETTYTVSMNDVEVGSGAETVAVEPGVTTERTSVTVSHDRLVEWWISHLENGERTDVVVDARVFGDSVGGIPAVSETRTIETDLLSAVNSTDRRPIDVDAPIVGEQTLYVEETRAQWGDVGDDRTEVDLEVTVENPTPVDAPVTRVGYAVSTNGSVVEEGDLEADVRLEAGESTEVDLTVPVDHDLLTRWWVSHLENGERTDLEIDLEVDVTAPTGTTVSLEGLTYERTIETDLWGEGVEASREREAIS